MQEKLFQSENINELKYKHLRSEIHSLEMKFLDDSANLPSMRDPEYEEKTEKQEWNHDDVDEIASSEISAEDLTEEEIEIAKQAIQTFRNNKFN